MKCSFYFSATEVFFRTMEPILQGSQSVAFNLYIYAGRRGRSCGCRKTSMGGIFALKCLQCIVIPYYCRFSYGIVLVVILSYKIMQPCRTEFFETTGPRLHDLASGRLRTRGRVLATTEQGPFFCRALCILESGLYLVAERNFLLLTSVKSILCRSFSNYKTKQLFAVRYHLRFN